MLPAGAGRYPHLGEYAFGAVGYWVVAVMLVLSQYAFTIAAHVLIAPRCGRAGRTIAS